MKCIVTVNMDGAAFWEDSAPGYELGRILAQCAKHVSDNPGETPATLALRDSNGNSVGYLEVQEEESKP
jgi:hypothetical protein